MIKRFNIGDHVKIISRCKTKGSTGVVVEITNDDHGMYLVKFDSHHSFLTDKANNNGVIYNVHSLELIDPSEPKKVNGKFWMIISNGHYDQYSSKEEAEADAERLVKENPGVDFFVVEATSCKKAG